MSLYAVSRRARRIVRADLGPMSSRANSSSMAMKSVSNTRYLEIIFDAPRLAGDGELPCAPSSVSVTMLKLLSGLREARRLGGCCELEWSLSERRSFGWIPTSGKKLSEYTVY